MIASVRDNILQWQKFEIHTLIHLNSAHHLILLLSYHNPIIQITG